ncbi:MBL fold metallo-hydrolase [Aliikangiella sp. IMCC44653]
MRKTAKFTLAASLIFSCLNPLVAKQKKPYFEALEVTPGLHMLIGVGGFTGGNIGLSSGVDGVVMIDDSMPPLLDSMQEAIKSVTDKPVDFLINTHVHGDHTGNNAAMGKAGTHIVAHENLRKHLLNKGITTSEGNKPAPKSALPVITFAQEMSFHLNGDEAHLFHVSHAHTDGDAVIHFKKANVIHTGDTFFNGLFPYIDADSGGSLDGYIAAQNKILAIANPKTKIIPGHGPLATAKDLQASVDMLVDCKAIVKRLVDSGKSEAEILALDPLKKYTDKWSWGFITTEKMTKQIYRGLTQQQAKSAHSH